MFGSRYTLEREIVADARMVDTLEREQPRMVFGSRYTLEREIVADPRMVGTL